MLRALGRWAVPAAFAVPLLVGGLLAGTGTLAVPGGEGPTVLAVPRNGPLGATSPRDLEPEPDPQRFGAHPVTFPSGGTVRARPAVAKDPAPLPDFSDRAVPALVMAAYRMGAAVLARTDPGCRVGWPLLAAVGKVESGHAYGGAVDRRGDTLIPILGPVLDGGPGVAAIADTDDGRWDTDKTWDRAVGPMQFIPGSWVLHGQDGNGDGRRDPNNVVDAVLAAAYYLCGGSGDLTVERDRRAAVFSYNHSWDYVDLVLAWADAYASGTPVLTGALPGALGADKASRPGRPTGGPTRPGATVGVPAGEVPVAGSAPVGPVAPAPTAPAAGPSGGDPGSGPSAEPSREPKPAGSQPTTEPSREPTHDPTTAAPSPSPTPDEPSPTPSATTSPEPCPSPSETPTPSESPTPTPTPTPTESPSPTPTPTDSCGPSGSS
jgi:hypothetical protein